MVLGEDDTLNGAEAGRRTRKRRPTWRPRPSEIDEAMSDEDRETSRCFRRNAASFLPTIGVLRPVGLPSALPSPALPKDRLRGSWIKEVGFRRYKPMLRFSCGYFNRVTTILPLGPYGPRYQTAGSIGALARDEPVTPGVTFLSPPAPNSEDTEDR